MTIEVIHGDMLKELPKLAADSISAVVTDPPYHLGPSQGRASRAPEGMYATMRSGFMGKQWDGGDIAFRPETWAAVWRVMKPGAHLLAFGGTRTSHRMVCAIEDAGFEIRDTLMFLYGSGFPKSLDVSKQIDRMAGAEREVISRTATKVGVFAHSGSGVPQNIQDYEHVVTAPATPEAKQWQGWGTSLKPAYEPIILARKPLTEKTVAANVLRYGTGAINVDACRVPTEETITATRNIALGSSVSGVYGAATVPGVYEQQPGGRWPANVVHDGSDEVEAAFAAFGSSVSSNKPRNNGEFKSIAKGREYAHTTYGHADEGSPSRFFARCAFSPDELRFHYSGKADALDRAGSSHPTIKPVSLMRWLIRLITPPIAFVCERCDKTSYDKSTKDLSDMPKAVSASRQDEPVLFDCMSSDKQQKSHSAMPDMRQEPHLEKINRTPKEVLLQGVRGSSDEEGNTERDVHSVRKDISARSPVAKGDILFEELCGESNSGEMGEGFLFRPERLPTSLPTRSPASEPNGIHHGTPAGDGGGIRSSSIANGGCASPQREQGGQQAREPGGNGKAQPRQNPQASPKADSVSSLRRHDQGVGACPTCGGNLTRRASVVLDCFAGSGTTGEACMLEGFDAILIEQDAAHVADIRHRMKRWSGADLPLFADG